jgi:hypothetical protein
MSDNVADRLLDRRAAWLGRSISRVVDVSGLVAPQVACCQWTRFIPQREGAIVFRGRVIGRWAATVALAGMWFSPAAPARAAGANDITGQVLAGQDIALTGDSIVNLVPAENFIRAGQR